VDDPAKAVPIEARGRLGFRALSINACAANWPLRARSRFLRPEGIGHARRIPRQQDVRIPGSIEVVAVRNGVGPDGKGVGVLKIQMREEISKPRSDAAAGF